MVSRRLTDLTGQKFGRLTILKKETHPTCNTDFNWRCLCECGAQKVIDGYQLLSGGAKSCGCLKKEMYKLTTAANKLKPKIFGTDEDLKFITHSYLILQKSSVEMARELGTYPSIILKRLKEAGVSRRKNEDIKSHKMTIRKPRKVAIERIIALYESGMTLEEVGREVGHAFQYISRRLKEAGVPMIPRYENHVFLSDRLIEILDGLLLGDGHLSSVSRGYASSALSVIQVYFKEDWLIQIASQLSDLQVKTTSYNRESMKFEIRGQEVNSKKAVVMCSLFYREFAKERRRWYPDDIKVVPNDVKLTPISIAHWYFGDGCLSVKNGYPQITMSTNGFTYPECDMLSQKLKSLYDLTFHVNKGPVMRCGRKEEVRKFCDIVAPFAPASFQYKLLANR